VSKFNSHWIERNQYLRPKPGTTEAEHHYETFERPVIVCLCGSTRFKDAWHAEMKRLTQQEMKIVLTVGDLDPRPEARNVNVPLDPDLKERLDELHKRKIDLADEVLILNVGGYIGDSTRSELEYARRHHKTIRFLEPPAEGV
jgi:hypothetical protein